MNYIELDNKHIVNTYKRQPIVLQNGSGATCKDVDGKEYIDFSSGIGVNSLGFCDDNWVKAVSEQASKIQHCSNLYYTIPQVELAKKLTEMTGYSSVFFSNSGAEANECAIKVARKYSFEKYGEKRFKILTLVNSFHGRTITTLKATGQDVFHQFFFPFTEGFEYIEAGDLEGAKKELSTGEYCAVMVEMVQGEGGVIALDQSYVKELNSYCQENDILFIADEVQTGIGRTGKLLASQHYDVTPDLTTLAKGLGGGLPIGAILFNEKTKNVLKYSDHGTTYGGNPIVCAGALTVLENVDVARVQELGDYIKKELEAVDEVEAVTGLGMMIGLKLKSKVAVEVIESCIKDGLIVLSAKEKVRLLPPLNISKEELDKGLDILKRVLTGE